MTYDTYLGPGMEYSGTPLKQTPLGPKSLSVIQGCPLLRDYASHTPQTKEHGRQVPMPNCTIWIINSIENTLLMDLKATLTFILDIDIVRFTE